jgi:hypothetical protein
MGLNFFYVQVSRKNFGKVDRGYTGINFSKVATKKKALTTRMKAFLRIKTKIILV